MQHDEKLETCPFIRQLFINKNSARENLLQNNHKKGPRPKDFNRNNDTSNTAPTQSTIDDHWPKANSVRFEDLYDHINPMDNTHEDTHLMDTKEQIIEYFQVEQEELFEDKNENTVT